ncbi:MAG TPA: aspartate-semialdehyde dehydrogenase [Pyrinomonadaceae bacterium]|nr:aspartate-semialdehyde dehydrogenase [Pyrinomonadaceae bacterium]
MSPLVEREHEYSGIESINISSLTGLTKRRQKTAYVFWLDLAWLLQQMTKKLRVGILGATGMVGQRFIQLLEDHPQFEITALAASDRSQGKRFAEACAWRLAGEMPAFVRSMKVAAPEPPLDCDLIFSSLPGDIARASEGAFARAGFPVISNSSAFRMDRDVPLLIPEVNSEHLALLEVQKNNGGGQKGYIVTNPNCSTIMLALALAPLHAKFGVKSVIATTMQALSGAGYPGVPSLAISDNVLPFIEGEEEKIEQETLKILGKVQGAGVEDAPMAVSAQCHRVNVSDGHMAAVRVKLNQTAGIDDVKDALASFASRPQELQLYSAPQNPIIVREELDRPQSRLDRDAGNGMSVTVGRIFPDNVLDYRFVALSHNTIRGAAGAAILNAELLIAMGQL